MTSRVQILKRGRADEVPERPKHLPRLTEYLHTKSPILRSLRFASKFSLEPSTPPFCLSRFHFATSKRIFLLTCPAVIFNVIHPASTSRCPLKGPQSSRLRTRDHSCHFPPNAPRPCKVKNAVEMFLRFLTTLLNLEEGLGVILPLHCAASSTSEKRCLPCCFFLLRKVRVYAQEHVIFPVYFPHHVF